MAKKKIPHGRPAKFWYKTFLTELRKSANVRHSCEHAGVSQITAYKWRKLNKEITYEQEKIGFGDAWAHALAESVEMLESEARRRAMHGVEKNVYHNGQVCGVESKYSDTLLIFLLKAHKPTMYREQIDHRHKVEGKISLDSFVKGFGNDSDS